MIPTTKQDRPNCSEQYYCSHCGRRLVPGDGDKVERWNFCPRCGERIEWDKAVPVTWEEKHCNVCGGWLIAKHPMGFWYASSDYIGEDTCKTCWIEECLNTNCLECKRGTYPDCHWLNQKKHYQTPD